MLRTPNKVRITTQLIRAATDEHIWAESFDRDPGDILAMSSEIAREVARRVKVTLTVHEEAQLATRRAANPEAYDAYLRGRFHWNKRTKDEDRAFEWLNKAVNEQSAGLVTIRIDPRLDSLRSDPRFVAVLKKIGLDK